MSSHAAAPWTTTQRWLTAAAVLAAVGFVGWIAWSRNRPKAQEVWASARAAADRRQWQQALSLAEHAMEISAPSTRELTTAGIIAVQARQRERAEAYFSRIHDEQPGAAAAQKLAGSAWLAAGFVTPAERSFRRALNLNPSDQGTRLQLCELLRLSGRYFELEPQVRELIATGDCPSALLFALAWPDHLWLDAADRAQIETYLQSDAAGNWISMGIASADVLTEDARKSARELLRTVALRDDGQPEAFARWGMLLADSGMWSELPTWNRSLPEDALMHPQVWYVRGLWQLQQGHEDAAIRCFWEALERGPFHAGATYQLSQLLRSRDGRQADGFAEQSQRLTNLRQHVVYGQGTGAFPGPNVLRSIVAGLEELGRDWEVLGWCQLALARHPQLRWPVARMEACSQRLTPDSPWIGIDHRISNRIRLDQYPLPKFDALGVAAAANGMARRLDAIRFDDVAGSMGLEFQFTNGSSIEAPRGYMYEISGGGIGVMDYDLNGWPDVYLSEGGPVLTLPRDPAKSDRLFQNQLGEGVSDVTRAARIEALEYGQGVTVGDINSDGFPDVFVANIGPNQLWINQGDGSFVNATSAAGLTGSVWTMSAVIADLSGDGLADLYEVNYLGGDALAKTCLRDGVVVQCRPSMFAAEPNRLWINLGDGRLADAASSIAHALPVGKSMGVVAADFDGQAGLDLYIANDKEPNTYLRHEAAADAEAPSFVDDAVPYGLAFGGDGQPLASMGIAVDDVNQDGRLDLCVTNFLSESSNLYVQDSSGLFADSSRTYGIYEQSFAVMGWGAQFLDADLDGWPDLVVANGHLEDYRRWNVPSQMPTQIYRNIGGRRFELQEADQLGPYFEQRHFGRTVARFDGNRDGRADFLVTHVGTPVAWLQNATASVGHFLSVQLVGTASERDAIGTRVYVGTSKQVQRRQLTAGDGFQASNQRQLTIGLGDATVVDELIVDWPSGLQQRYDRIPADQEILLREGDAEWYAVPNPGNTTPTSSK